MVPVFRSLDEFPATFGPTVAAIGNFDGVHLGHRRLLSSAVAEAGRSGTRALAITFAPHPEHFLRPERAPRLITPLAERLRLLRTTGVDAILVLPFNAELAQLSARDFTREILVERLGVRALHEGQSFRFGHRAAAGVEELARFGREYGFEVRVHDAVRVHGLEVSSSAVRALIGKGDTRGARWMLGRWFAVFSTPAGGRGIGTRLLVPTVNLAPTENLVPANGVYVTCLTIAGQRFESVTNVGNRPTFGEASFAIESHILDFKPVEIGGFSGCGPAGGETETLGAGETTPLELEFLLRLREEKTWPRIEALREQIVRDVARAKRYFRIARVH